MLVKEILTEVMFTDRKEALRNKTNKRDFTVCYYLQYGHTKKILMKHWHVIQQQPKLKQIFNQPPIV